MNIQKDFFHKENRKKEGLQIKFHRLYVHSLVIVVLVHESKHCKYKRWFRRHCRPYWDDPNEYIEKARK